MTVVERWVYTHGEEKMKFDLRCLHTLRPAVLCRTDEQHRYTELYKKNWRRLLKWGKVVRLFQQFENKFQHNELL